MKDIFRWLGLGLLGLLLIACQSDTPAQDEEVPENALACAQDSYVTAYTPDWQPLPAADAAALDPAVVAARKRILGDDYNDPQQVKVWWFGVSSFVVSAAGHLFLLDAWESVGLHTDYVPIGREELVELAPEVIFIGHGHFDHAADMGYVAGHTSAVLVGGEATCATAREQAARDGNQDAFECLLLGDAQTPEIGTIQQLRIWQDVEPVSILRHTHSAADPGDLLNGGTPFVYIPDLLAYLQHLNTKPQEIAWFLQSLDDEVGNSPPGGVWAYHFQFGDFTMLWHDSAGPIADGKPFADEIRCSLNSLPQCVDVQLGTIVGFGAVTSGLRDVGLYPRNAYPKLFLPNHHDAWAPVIGPGAVAFEQGWRAEIASMPYPPELDYLRDPEDYMAVRSWYIDAPRWQLPSTGSSCQ